MAFIDEAKFFVKGGDGGRGCISFRREKYVPKGGPDGGDGGDGGTVYLEASSRLHSLIDFAYKSHFIADSGVHGQGKKMHGKNGRDLVVLVPRGAVIKDADSGEVLADLVNEGDRFCAAQGGSGGRGNVHFATSVNRAPRRATPGYPGEERWLRIELKLIADVGLLGLPNAGKSTLLSKLSAAHPKIAAYPFTTLEPQLGIMRLEESDEPFVIADIPGLIHGAHHGAGLGHKFLRHIERTRLLLHLIDASGPEDEPWQNYQTIEEELRQYNEALVGRECLVVLNKIDEIDEERLAEVITLFTQQGVAVAAISALTGQGLAALQERLAEVLTAKEADDEPPATPAEAIVSEQ